MTVTHIQLCNEAEIYNCLPTTYSASKLGADHKRAAQAVFIACHNTRVNVYNYITVHKVAANLVNKTPVTTLNYISNQGELTKSTYWSNVVKSICSMYGYTGHGELNPQSAP